jgi:heat shock protein HslJ
MSSNLKLFNYTIIILFLIALCLSCTLFQKENNTAIVRNGLPLACQWILERFNNNDTLVHTKSYYINIDEKHQSFTGHAACNTIGGSMIVKGNTIKFTNIIATEMACENMHIEKLFIDNLLNATSYSIKGGELFLYHSNELLMTLESFR